MHQTLYRKYRPRTFDSVCGEDHISSVLRYESETGHLSHAYLFCGPRGTGKTSCAKILAKSVNCEHPVNGNPCGECFACQSIDDGLAPDVLEIDAASNNGVDNIREIRDAVNYTPASLKKRVYIIDEVHMLSTAAFNALLKTLEEPPEHVLFILATTEFHKLPATIISRCQRFDFRRIKADVISQRLKYIAAEENIPLEDGAAILLAKQAQGGMRDAISLLELCSAGGESVTEQHVRDVLGLATIEFLYKTAFAISKNDTKSIFNIVSNIESSSKDISVYWQELIGFWRDMLVYKNLAKEEIPSYFNYTDAELRLLDDAAKRFTSEKLAFHFSLLDEALKEMSRIPQTKRLCAELTLIKMSDPKLDSSIDALISRISALEEKITLLQVSPEKVTVPVTESIPSPSTNDDVKVQSVSSPKPEVAEQPMQQVVAPVAANTMEPVTDTGEFLEYIKEKDISLFALLENLEIFVSNESKKVVIKVVEEFTKKSLELDYRSPIVRQALVISGIAQNDYEVKIELGAQPKKQNKLDELSEF